MSSIPQNTENKNKIFDSATRFLKEFQAGKLLFQCNAGKMKGILGWTSSVICSVSFSPTEVCICKGKQVFLKVDSDMEFFHITGPELETFSASFIQRLPKYIP